MTQSDELSIRLEPVFSQFPEIAVAYLFGSMARGQAGPRSDVDIGLVLFGRHPTSVQHYWMIADLATRLEAFFPGRDVDVVLLEPQGAVFCHEVLLHGRAIYTAGAARRVDFESDTMVRAFDERPLAAWADRVYFRSLKERRQEKSK